MGTALRAELARLAGTREDIREVRGAGLYVGGVEVDGRDTARRLVNAMRERRVLISVCGGARQRAQDQAADGVLLADVDRFCTEFEAVLAQL